MHDIELVRLGSFHANRQDLEPSQAADMVNDFSHVSPFEATQDSLIIDFKALQAGHFVVILLLFLVKLVNSSHCSLLCGGQTLHEGEITVSYQVFTFLVFFTSS